MNHVVTPARAFVPSPYQQRLFDFVAKGRGSAIVKAVAGSGKTTSILKSLGFIPAGVSVQLFAFNSTIAAELRQRVQAMADECGDPRRFASVRASTFHAVGYGALCRRLGKRPDEVKPDPKKMTKLSKALLGEAEHVMYAEFCVKLVGLAKGEGAGAIVAFSEDRWRDLIHHHDLFLDDEEASEDRAIAIARELLRASNEQAKLGIIDYDDQLYVPLLWRLRLWQNDFVFVDEAQDTNPVRRALAKLALRPGGRLIAVGDERQAIYGFTGASHDAMELIKTEFGCVELPLTVSYRCAKKIVELAQDLVPYLEAFDGAAEGEVCFMPLFEKRKNAAKDTYALGRLGPNDAILCRNTAPLIKLAYQLIARGTACRLLGREIGAGLASLVKQMKARDINSLVTKLDRYVEREVAAATAKGEEQRAEAITDRVACVTTVIEHLGEDERTIAGLLRRLETMFEDQGAGQLTLCTAHKAKGKEWPTVAILAPELMPSKWARQEWQLRQEENLMYVAWTRAMRTLIFLEGE